MSVTIWTLGHSTRTAAEFLSVVQSHTIELVVDVRRFPGSRRLPQFSADSLEAELARIGTAYWWIEALGGRRRPEPASPNVGWRHPSFRAYADHVASEEFAQGLLELLMLVHGLRTAILCSEVLWWRCHRRIIADVLVVQGMHVVHLRDETAGVEHTLGPPAKLVRGQLSYEHE